MSCARETLEQCCLKLQNLSENIERIRSAARNFNTDRRSPTSVAPPPTPTSETKTSANMPPKRAAARCHECHGPISGYHQGYPHGLGVCELEHYDLCPGGVTDKDKGGHTWVPCPAKYEPPFGDGFQEGLLSEGGDDYVNTDHESGTESPASKSGDQEYSPGPGFIPSLPQLQKRSTRSNKNSNEDDIRVTASEETDLTRRIGFSAQGASSLATSNNHQSSENEKSEEDLILEKELAELAIAETKEKKLKHAADVRRKKEQALENIERLSRMSQGEGARKRTDIHNNIDMLRSANRPQVDSKRTASRYQGPLMTEIRRDEYTNEHVNDMMEHVHDIPAFSNATQQRHGQPRLKSSTQPRQVGVGIGRSNRTLPADILYKWVLRRDMHGVEYQELVEVPAQAEEVRPRHVVETELGWFYDDKTNRMYKKQTPTQPRPVVRTDSVQQQFYVDSRRDGATPARQQQWSGVTHTPVRVEDDASDRFPGIVPLTVQPAEDREGKTPLSIASHARNLPMEYAKSATSKNMNFAVFMYGAIHELHSSRIGMTPAMPKGVLEAKLQHLMNIIHVTCLNATAADFKPVAWSVGRTYHNLVQSKVDSGREGWNDFDMLHRGSPHAAEMVAAEREHREALLRKPDKADPKGDPKQREKKDDKPPCTTWNDYAIEGKCKYETDHPGEKCNRSHHCSYCKKKNPAWRTYHQARYCLKKQEADDK